MQLLSANIGGREEEEEKKEPFGNQREEIFSAEKEEDIRREGFSTEKMDEFDGIDNAEKIEKILEREDAKVCIEDGDEKSGNVSGEITLTEAEDHVRAENEHFESICQECI